jgi:hypothetical protein
MAKQKQQTEPTPPRFSADPAKALLELVDAAYDLVEIYDTGDSPYNRVWKKAWLQKARELGASPSF